RTDPKGAERQSGRIRSAQISQTRDGGDGQALQAAAAGFQCCRASEQDQEGVLSGRDGETLRQGRARPQCREMASRSWSSRQPALGRGFSWELPENRLF